MTTYQALGLFAVIIGCTYMVLEDIKKLRAEVQQVRELVWKLRDPSRTGWE